MKSENALILELCKFFHPDKKKIEELMTQSLHWPYVLGQLLFHRMGGAAYDTLRTCGLLGRLHREVRHSLEMAYEGGKEKVKSFQLMLCDLAPLFQCADFPYALLKGAYLNSLYPAGLRFSYDLDILIKGQDLSGLETLLKSAGFEQGHVRNGSFAPAARVEIIASRMNRGETVPFIRQVDLPGMKFCEIDINFSLDFKAKQETDAVPALLQNAELLITAGQERLRTLAPADFLIHLCCHLYKEASVYAWVEMARDLALYKFADISLLLDQWADRDFYDDLMLRINRHGLEKECYYALAHTRTLFNLQDDVLERMLNSIRPADTGFMSLVTDPQENRIYQYDMEMTDWIFCPNRKEHLYEVGNGLISGTGDTHYLLRFGRVR